MDFMVHKDLTMNGCTIFAFIWRSLFSCRGIVKGSLHCNGYGRARDDCVMSLNDLASAFTKDPLR